MQPLPADKMIATWRQIQSCKDRLNELTPTAKEHVQQIYRDGKNGISLQVESKRRWYIARGLLAIAEKFGEETEPWMFTIINYLTGDTTTPVATQLARLDLMGSSNFFMVCMDFTCDEIYPIFGENGTHWQRA